MEKKKTWEKKKKYSNERVKQVMNDKVRQLKSLAETVLRTRCFLIL